MMNRTLNNMVRAMFAQAKYANLKLFLGSCYESGGISQKQIAELRNR
jgi:hypothetical protein